jgi:hypothetical protein
MGKTWAAVALVLVAAGPAAVRAADPAVRRVVRRQDAFGSDYLPSTQGGTPTAPAGTTTLPPATPPAAVAEPAPVHAGPPDTPGCADCGHGEAAHQHFACIHRLIDWATYCPLKKGVNCDPCGYNGHGDCCCYHCFPPLYLFFLQPCVDGHVPSPPCHGGHSGGCPSCGGAAPPADHDAPADGEHHGFFGHRLFHLSTGFGCGSVGCR